MMEETKEQQLIIIYPYLKEKYMRIVSDLPIALYDCNQKQLVGIFKSVTLCAKYIYGDIQNARHHTRIVSSRKTKGRINHNGMAYTVRTANEQQQALIGSEQYVMANNYPEPTAHNMKSFDSTRISLADESMHRLDIYTNERNRKSENKRII
jgi:hypothetical protein